MVDDKKKTEEEKKQIKLSPEIRKYLDEWTNNPKSTVFVKLAEEYIKSGLIDEAKQVCEDGLAANPSYLSGNLVLAKIHFDMGNFDDAFTEVKKVTSAQTDNIMAQNLLLDVYIKKGDKDNAITQCDIISFLDPNNEDVISRKKELETRGISHKELAPEPEEEVADDVTEYFTDYGQVKTQVQEDVPQEEPNHEITTNTVADLYIEQGFYDKGLNIYKEMLKESPDNQQLVDKVREIQAMVSGGGSASAPVKAPEPQNVIYSEPPPAPAPVQEEQVTKAPPPPVEPSGKERKIDKLSGWLDKIKGKSDK